MADMPSEEEIRAMLMAAFQPEAEEHQQIINDLLLQLEEQGADASPEILEEIFRSAHTLKGSARAVEMPDVEEVTHHLESLFRALQKGELQVSSEIIDLSLQTMDLVKELIQAGVESREPTIDRAEIVARLEAALHGPAEETTEATDTQESAKPEAQEAAELAVQPDQTAPHKKKSNKSPEETIRVSTSKLDSLMAQVGELLASRIDAEQRILDVRVLHDRITNVELDIRQTKLLADQLLAQGVDIDPIRDGLARASEHLGETRGNAERLQRRSDAAARRLGQVVGGLQDEVRRTRMLPVSTITDTFPRLIRDLSRQLEKQVEFELVGGETEVDKMVLEQLKAPLTHMIRNSVDHGLESAQERKAAGKPEKGTVVLEASQRGASLIIQIRDDGAGIDADRVRASAVRNGILDQEAADALSAQEAVALIFRAELSTKTEVTDVSGRGVGMDVVREQVEKLHGTVEVDSVQGQGTTFTLSLPVSVATTRLLFIRVGNQQFALPVSNVERIISAQDGQTGVTEGQSTLVLDEQPLPLVSLAEQLGVPVPEHRGDEEAVLILQNGDRRAAFQVQEILGAQESAVKNLPVPLYSVEHISGATIVGSGEVVCILATPDLLRGAVQASMGGAAAVRVRSEGNTGGSETTADPNRIPRVMVVDDSVTIRTLQRSMLLAAGYDVVVAADGLEAWEMLDGLEVDLIVSDVEMPVMNGFELTRRVRSSQTMRDLPVLLVTSLNAPEDRRQGIEAGADAYVIKGSSQHDELLQMVRRMV